MTKFRNVTYMGRSCVPCSPVKRGGFEEKKVICKVSNRWVSERVEQTRATRGSSTGKQAAAVQKGRSAPSEEGRKHTSA